VRANLGIGAGGSARALRIRWSIPQLIGLKGGISGVWLRYLIPLLNKESIMEQEEVRTHIPRLDDGKRSEHLAAFSRLAWLCLDLLS
jgi:hypothetical protein